MTQDTQTVSQPRYFEVTNSVRVSVEPCPLLDRSNPEHNVYAFSYQITIENLGTRTVQLLERHWMIFSAGVKTGEVKAAGVVGLQPLIPPGETFEYTSSAVIPDPIGYMEGDYLLRDDAENEFSVTIPRFSLIFPQMVH